MFDSHVCNVAVIFPSNCQYQRVHPGKLLRCLLIGDAGMSIRDHGEQFVASTFYLKPLDYAGATLLKSLPAYRMDALHV